MTYTPPAHAKHDLRRARLHLEEAAACLDNGDPRMLAVLEHLSICLDECVELEYTKPRESARVLAFVRPR